MKSRIPAFFSRKDAIANGSPQKLFGMEALQALYDELLEAETSRGSSPYVLKDLEPFQILKFLLPDNIAKGVQRWTSSIVQDVAVLVPAESKDEAKQPTSTTKRTEVK